jgi:hypothetical protein
MRNLSYYRQFSTPYVAAKAVQDPFKSTLEILRDTFKAVLIFLSDNWLKDSLRLVYSLGI